MVRRCGFALLACVLALPVPGRATQYQNPDGSVSSGVVPEVGGRAVGPGNPAPVAITSAPAATVASQAGTITAQGQSLTLNVAGHASAVVSVVGTFTGTLRFRGAADLQAATALGGRLLFKSGVGSLGFNTVVGTGAAIANEYRVVAGGQQIVIDAPTWTSGSAAIVLTATANPSIVFVNGPVHSAEEEAVRASRGFSASTGVQAVSAGNYLSYLLTNPAGSGVRLHIRTRSFECNLATGSTAPEWTFVPNPTTGPTYTSGTIANRFTGGPVSAATFGWSMSATPPGPQASPVQGGMVPTGGTVREITTERVLMPGNSFAHAIGGPNTGLSAAARCGMNAVWYEEAIN